MHTVLQTAVFPFTLVFCTSHHFREMLPTEEWEIPVKKSQWKNPSESGVVNAGLQSDSKKHKFGI